MSNNKAEGFDRMNEQGFVRFLYISQASCSEVKSMLYPANRLNYMERETTQHFIANANEVGRIIRGLNYHFTDETFPFEFNNFVKQVEHGGYRDTPNRGFYDRMHTDSDVERKFVLGADLDDEIICLTKPPAYYKIPTPIGNYNPDFGIVMKRNSLRDGKESEFYFVIETKGTNDINDKKALKESEIYKIECALKHFTILGVEVQYKAPVKDSRYFKTEASKNINALNEK